ncbi:hypothetical protein ACFSKM_21495 [Ancylobacter dichloromethanicus]
MVARLRRLRQMRRLPLRGARRLAVIVAVGMRLGMGMPAGAVGFVVMMIVAAMHVLSLLRASRPPAAAPQHDDVQ